VVQAPATTVVADAELDVYFVANDLDGCADDDSQVLSVKGAVLEDLRYGEAQSRIATLLPGWLNNDIESLVEVEFVQAFQIGFVQVVRPLHS